MLQAWGLTPREWFDLTEEERAFMIGHWSKKREMAQEKGSPQSMSGLTGGLP